DHLAGDRHGRVLCIRPEAQSRSGRDRPGGQALTPWQYIAPSVSAGTGCPENSAAGSSKEMRFSNQYLIGELLRHRTGFGQRCRIESLYDQIGQCIDEVRIDWLDCGSPLSTRPTNFIREFCPTIGSASRITRRTNSAAEIRRTCACFFASM